MCRSGCDGNAIEPGPSVLLAIVCAVFAKPNKKEDVREVR